MHFDPHHIVSKPKRGQKSGKTSRIKLVSDPLTVGHSMLQQQQREQMAQQQMMAQQQLQGPQQQQQQVRAMFAIARAADIVARASFAVARAI